MLLLAGCGGGSQPSDTPTSLPIATFTPAPPTAIPTPTHGPATPTATLPATRTSTPTPIPASTPTATPTPMPNPTIVGTVRFLVDIPQGTTPAEVGQRGIAGPSLIRLKDGRYRLYVQARAERGNKDMDGANIISLISTEGTQWDFEPGVRIPHGSESDVDFEAGEPGVYLGLNGKYYMAYTGRQMGVNRSGVSQLMHSWPVGAGGKSVPRLTRQLRFSSRSWQTWRTCPVLRTYPVTANAP